MHFKFSALRHDSSCSAIMLTHIMILIILKMLIILIMLIMAIMLYRIIIDCLLL